MRIFRIIRTRNQISKDMATHSFQDKTIRLNKEDLMTRSNNSHQNGYDCLLIVFFIFILVNMLNNEYLIISYHLMIAWQLQIKKMQFEKLFVLLGMIFVCRNTAQLMQTLSFRTFDHLFLPKFTGTLVVASSRYPGRLRLS